jgi:hypothetical protein
MRSNRSRIRSSDNKGYNPIRGAHSNLSSTNHNAIQTHSPKHIHSSPPKDQPNDPHSRNPTHSTFNATTHPSLGLLSQSTSKTASQQPHGPPLTTQQQPHPGPILTQSIISPNRAPSISSRYDHQSDGHHDQPPHPPLSSQRLKSSRHIPITSRRKFSSWSKRATFNRDDDDNDDDDIEKKIRERNFQNQNHRSTNTPSTPNTQTPPNTKIFSPSAQNSLKPPQYSQSIPQPENTSRPLSGVFQGKADNSDKKTNASSQGNQSLPHSTSKIEATISATKENLLKKFSDFGARLEFEKATVDPLLEVRLQKWREFGEKQREAEILAEIEERKLHNQISELTKRIFEPIFGPVTDADRYGHYPDHIGTRHEYSDLQPLIFSSNEFPSHLKADTEKFLKWTGLKRFTDMGFELFDDIVDHLNKSEPFGQRKKDRKYRLKSKLNKPYARYSFDAMEEELREQQADFHELEQDYWVQRDLNERKSLALKRKARRAMGLEPDLELEERWAEITAEAPAMLRPSTRHIEKLGISDQKMSEFERFREEFKAKEDVYAEGGKDKYVSIGSTTDPFGKTPEINPSKIYKPKYNADNEQRGETVDEVKEFDKKRRKRQEKNKGTLPGDSDFSDFENDDEFSDDDVIGTIDGVPVKKADLYDPKTNGKYLKTDEKGNQYYELDGDIDDFRNWYDDPEVDERDHEEMLHKQRVQAAKKRRKYLKDDDPEDELLSFQRPNTTSDGNTISDPNIPVDQRKQREKGGTRNFDDEKHGNPDFTQEPLPAQRRGKRDLSGNAVERSLNTLVDILKRQQEFQDPNAEESGWFSLKPRLLIHDNNGLTMPRDDLFGYPQHYMEAMPADEEDMDQLEREHWKRRVRQANHRKYFKHGWKYDIRWGMGPKYTASDLGYIDPTFTQDGNPSSQESHSPPKWSLTHFGFQGLGAPRNDSQGGPAYIYDYIYGREIPQMKSHGGILSIDLFREFPPIFRTRDPEHDSWTGTTALTYNPQQNHITRWELRRQTLKYKISMSPLGDLARFAWKMFNIDVFPLTHFRLPFAWIMSHGRWLMGLRHALARWSKTATHLYIDQRFAYQANRFGEHQVKDIYHYINEYDYLKDYQLPIVLRAIREYDFDTLRSACSQHALFNVLKWLHIQDRFGVYFEYRRNYWVESLDIKDVRKNEYGHLILDVEFVVIEPPYFYNKAGGKIFAHKQQYKNFYRPQPLVMTMSLLRDYVHPDFDYQVIDFECDARRVKRVFNNIERIYHSAQRSRTQYFRAPKFYATRRTAVDHSYYSRRTKVVNAYHQNLENGVFQEKELDFQEDMEDRYSEMIKYRHSSMLQPYITALQLEPIMDHIVAKTKQHPAFQLHPIQRDTKAYWAQRKELDLIKFRQREARRVRAQQNTLHRYYHKLRSVGYFKHTYDHGGNLEEFRRLHIDKLALDSNHDDWVQKWFVDPERRGRPYFKNIESFANRAKRQLLDKVEEEDPLFGVEYDGWHGHREHYMLNRFKKHTFRQEMREAPADGGRRHRLRYKGRARKIGHNMRRGKFRKRRRFMPYMERVYVQLPRGAFWENKKFFRVRNHRINAFKGNTSMFSPKHKGPGYSIYDTTQHERWHVWDGGYYNPLEACWTRADVFHPNNQPFEPRRYYSYSFLEDHTTLIPHDPLRNWDLPWRMSQPALEEDEYPADDTRFLHQMLHEESVMPDYLQIGSDVKSNLPKFGDLPNAEIFSLNDDADFKDHTERRKWPSPQDDKWKI